MARFNDLYSALSGMLLLLPALVDPTLAHTIKVSQDVAATFHIEPRHNPKAGEPAQAWFALTYSGGAMIPLTQCDCKLAVYLEPRKVGEAPLLTPSLQPLAVEQYQGIPSAEITFPKPGAYGLELSGQPKAGAQFQPFELRYAVMVTAGAAPMIASPSPAIADKQSRFEPSPASQKAISSTRPSSPWLVPLTIGGAIVGIGALGFMLQRFRTKRP